MRNVPTQPIIHFPELDHTCLPPGASTGAHPHLWKVVPPRFRFVAIPVAMRPNTLVGRPRRAQSSPLWEASVTIRGLAKDHQTAVRKPDDFEAFWDAIDADLAAIPLDP